MCILFFVKILLYNTVFFVVFLATSYTIFIMCFINRLFFVDVCMEHDSTELLIAMQAPGMNRGVVQYLKDINVCKKRNLVI